MTGQMDEFSDLDLVVISRDGDGDGAAVLGDLPAAEREALAFCDSLA